MFTKAQQFVLLVQTDLLFYALQPGPPPDGYRPRSREWTSIFLNDAFRIAPEIPEEMSPSKAAEDFFEFSMRSTLQEGEASTRFPWIVRHKNLSAHSNS